MSELEPAETRLPQRLSDETRRQLDADASRRVKDGKTGGNTKRAFKQDWKVWCQFCAEEELHPLEMSSGLLVAFVAWLANGDDTTGRAPSAPATITRRLSGVMAGWKDNGQEPEHGITSDARNAVDIYKTELAKANRKVGRGQAPPLTMRQLRQIVAACPDTLAGKRDRAMLLIGFGIGARRSELANLAVNDVTEEPEGLVVRIRYAKTEPREVAIPFGTHPQTCPVRAWRAWLNAADLGGADERSAAFRRIDRHGNLGASISAQSVGQAITRAGQRADVHVRLTGHSIRAGMATEARRAGHDMLTIAQQGGWKPNSAELYRYTRIIDRWSDNALSGIGL